MQDYSKSVTLFSVLAATRFLLPPTALGGPPEVELLRGSRFCHENLKVAATIISIVMQWYKNKSF